MLMLGAEESEKTNWMIERVGNVSLAVEIQCFHPISAKADRMALMIQDNKRIWGELAAAQLGSIQ